MLGCAVVIDVAHLHPQLLTRLIVRGCEDRPRGARYIVPDPGRCIELLPLETEYRRGHTIRIGDDRRRRDELRCRGCDVGERHRADRRVIHVDHRRGWIGEHLLQHAVAILINGADTRVLRRSGSRS